MSDKVTVPKLDNENYEVWRILMDALLTRKGLQDVATGVTPRPTLGPNSTVTKAWVRKNAEARAELILHVEVDQLPHMTSDEAATIWDELERVHRARGLATRLALRRKFLTAKKKNDLPMARWIADVRGLAFRLTNGGVTVDDEDIILVLTMGLPQSYDTLVVALDSTPSTQLTLEYVIQRLLNEEARHTVGNTEEGEEKVKSEAALSTSTKPAKRSEKTPLAHITCFNCGKKGHYQINCPDKPDKKDGETKKSDDTKKVESAGFADSSARSTRSKGTTVVYDDW